ncbi:hypothetical protein NEIELOOT_02437 [Neisseria elongata subsp. glycolytica ATCC 29315]|uniref:Uncharacterized protein n=1 Tax=Neisseria elongata subsp. glycolytica ATCC 29315 TaxID=546263 RepID=D4DTN1_NEIEG|nr:hypothetical protein NEIELOOT_02437 [Neisseria elongata subsp. glycolytica ATCC 29315]
MLSNDRPSEKIFQTALLAKKGTFFILCGNFSKKTINCCWKVSEIIRKSVWVIYKSGILIQTAACFAERHHRRGGRIFQTAYRTAATKIRRQFL